MREYLEYLVLNRDDSPLYLFQSNIDKHDKARQILKEYQVPRFFQKDLLEELVSTTDAVKAGGAGRRELATVQWSTPLETCDICDLSADCSCVDVF